MDSKMKQKKVIKAYLSHIDIENIKAGSSLYCKIKTDFDLEIPYELQVMMNDKEEDTSRRNT